METGLILLLFLFFSHSGYCKQSVRHCCPLEDAPPVYRTYYYPQYVNHFDFSDDRVFNQKLLMSDNYWSDPVLLFYAGNEGAIEMFYQNSGFVFELAEEFNALVVFAEHRYYGNSLPFGSQDTFKPENMKYLSIEQAMADYAVLVTTLKQKYNLKKVIAFGGSYGGILAAYLRFKFPNIFDGALAASAPVYQIAGRTDSSAFFAKVTEDFKSADSNCPDQVRGALANIIDSASTTSGFDYISRSMKLCKTLTEDKVTHLVNWVRNSFTTIAMVDYPYPTSFLGNLPANPVNVACNILTSSDNKLTGLADAAGLLYNGTGTSKCYDIDTEFIDCADPTGCGTDLSALSWDYQACTEVNLNCTTNNITDMFPETTYDISEHCRTKWGLPNEKRTDWIGINYWIDNMSPASNIIFSNGNLDPWSVGGVKEDIGDSVIALMIEGGAHHLDLRSSNDQDPQSVTDAREQEKRIIKSWIEN